MALRRLARQKGATSVTPWTTPSKRRLLIVTGRTEPMPGIIVNASTSVVIVDAATGRVLRQHRACGAHGSLRDAVYDPASAGFLALSHHKTKGMVLVALRCKATAVAGDESAGSGWTDAEVGGATSRFSRPHAMTLLPGNVSEASWPENATLEAGGPASNLAAPRPPPRPP